MTWGRRVRFAGLAGVPIASDGRHAPPLRAAGDHRTARFDHVTLTEARDRRVAGTGRVAPWSIADSHTLFETPRIEVLP
jgi:hypothetical protein